MSAGARLAASRCAAAWARLATGCRCVDRRLHARGHRPGNGRGCARRRPSSARAAAAADAGMAAVATRDGGGRSASACVAIAVGALARRWFSPPPGATPRRATPRMARRWARCGSRCRACCCCGSPEPVDGRDCAVDLRGRVGDRYRRLCRRPPARRTAPGAALEPAQDLGRPGRRRSCAGAGRLGRGASARLVPGFYLWCWPSAGLAIIEQFGDLAELMAKRRFGVKDTSSLIPGHGGLLDRLDGLLAVIPAVALLIADRRRQRAGMAMSGAAAAIRRPVRTRQAETGRRRRAGSRSSVPPARSAAARSISWSATATNSPSRP